MIHSAIGLVHFTTAVTTLLIGLLIFLRPKGGRLHKFLGYVEQAKVSGTESTNVIA